MRSRLNCKGTLMLLSFDSSVRSLRATSIVVTHPTSFDALLNFSYNFGPGMPPFGCRN
jgi:hypothetical protein